MTRIAILAMLCACFLTPILAGPQEDRERAIANAVAVQTALVQGRDALQARNYRVAVTVLESQVTHIDGNREYLETLRNAYKGYIAELRQAKREDDAQLYLNRLTIIDPSVANDLRPALVTNPTAVAQTINPSKPAVLEQPAPAKGHGIRDEEPVNTPPADAGGSRQPTIVETPSRGPTYRGAMADPFSYDNSTQKQAKTFLQRAEEALRIDQFAEACRFYEKANQVDQSVVAPCRENWAYCKLHSTWEQLKNAPNSMPSYADLERDVRQAMSITPAPRVQDLGDKLLRNIQEYRNHAAREAAPKVDVVHQTGTTGWSLAETTNFRIYHKMTRDMADQAARATERTRSEMVQKWFGDKEPDWNPKCDIVVHATGDEYARTTGANSNLPGHSTTHSEHGRVLSRRVDLHSDNPNMLAAVLPHETTHVVLAGRFGEYTVPRWADEGMAVLTEPREKIDRHLQNLPKHMQEHQLFSVRDLMQMNDYPRPQLVGPFYAQSVSVVEYLVNQKGPKEFSEFLKDGLRGGYEPALKKHYNFQNFGELEQGWTQSAFHEPAAPTGVAKRSR